MNATLKDALARYTQSDARLVRIRNAQARLRDLVKEVLAGNNQAHTDIKAYVAQASVGKEFLGAHIIVLGDSGYAWHAGGLVRVAKEE